MDREGIDSRDDSDGLRRRSPHLEGMDDFTTCTAVPENADMMVKTKVTRNLNFIILDSRAYLYDENGKLMEVKQ